MNDALYGLLDKFVAVYLDDIVIYSEFFQDHLNHLELVFSRLWDNDLYVKKEKCELACTKVMFFGHWVSKGNMQMDGRKVHAIL